MSETKTLQHRIDGPDDAPVLVLGPALGTTWHMWDRQVPELARRWRVLRYDLPGHGGAPAHPATSVTELADRLLATLEELGIERFGYAGCGIGGAVGADLALREPQQVASLALVSASARFGTADEYRQRGVIVRTNGLEPIARSVPERWFTPGFTAAQQAIAEWSVQMVRTTDPGCYIAACEALASLDIRTSLERIGVPTLVLAGSEDQVTTPADARVLVAGIPDARLALVPGTSHLAPVEQPAAVTDLLVRHFGTAWQEGTAAIAAPPLKPVLAPVAPHSGPQTGTEAAHQPAHQTSHQTGTLTGLRTGTQTGAAVQSAGRPLAEIGSAEAPAEVVTGRQDPYEQGMKVRREVLGDAHVDRASAAADDFAAEFQEFITRYAWGEVWSRPGIDRRTRSVITLTALVSGGHLDELAFHTRAALRNGLTPAEIGEVLLHTAVYCGVPAANSAFRVAQEVIRQETTPQE
ncbi:bifunctional 3-oxoadipate enol-lactonase/4-carboxymuconolactone decarboxylase PcaDC [Streptomyces sp. 7N604]|uniref:bifunctional 3-oxoadipate enol-lactonase/4-carboxymuconolactone decarboxylase PcaDC n=1 Tax=Streptomyces sp. 7N604 TaxID=3457415 RepID=UPI003FD6191B